MRSDVDSVYSGIPWRQFTSTYVDTLEKGLDLQGVKGLERLRAETPKKKSAMSIEQEAIDLLTVTYQMAKRASRILTEMLCITSSHVKSSIDKAAAHVTCSRA